jgi:hypothetical protein
VALLRNIIGEGARPPFTIAERQHVQKWLTLDDPQGELDAACRPIPSSSSAPQEMFTEVASLYRSEAGLCDRMVALIHEESDWP